MHKLTARLMCCVVLGILTQALASPEAWSAPAKKATPAQQEEAPAEVMRGGFKPLLIDGALVKAVEQYVQPSPHQFGVGAGIFPVNPYYFGFSANGNYTYYFSESFAWEVVNATYVFSVEKNLTTDLANNFGVNPIKINRLNWLASTNGMSFFTYGKAVIFSDIVRYWRAGVIYGIGAVGTSQWNRVAANLGVRMEFYAGSGFAWRVELRNAMVIQDLSNFPTVLLGAGIGL